MNRDSIIARLVELNDESAKAHDHVCQVYEDGELTMQKGGALLGQRNLHCINEGVPARLPPKWFPNVTSDHGFIWVSYANKDSALAFILDAIEWHTAQRIYIARFSARLPTESTP